MADAPVTLDFSKAVPIGAPDTPPPAAQTLQSSVAYAATQNPDDYAKLLKLKQQTGVAPQVTAINRDTVQQAATVNSLDYPQLAVMHPRTTAWASNPDNAAVSGVDEIQRLARIEQHATTIRAQTPWERFEGQYLDPAKEKLFGGPGNPLRYLVADTVAGGTKMAGEIGSWFGWHGDSANQKNLLQRIGDYFTPANMNLMRNGVADTGDIGDKLMEVAGPTLATMGMSTGTSLLAKAAGLSPTAAKVLSGLAVGGMFSAQQGGSAYTMMKERGASDYEARVAANQTAVFNAPLNALFGATDVVPILKRNPFATSVGIGGAQGAVGQIVQNRITDQPWYQGLLESTLQGIGMQAGMHVGFGAMGEMVKEAQESKLRERSQEAFHDALTKTFEGDPSLQIPAQEFQTYFQSKNIDPAEMAANLGVKNYAEAVISGGHLEVPTPDFLAKLDPEHQNGLLPDIVDQRMGMTQRQYQAAREEIQTWMQSGGPEKLKAEMEQAAPAEPSPEYTAVRDELKARYVAAGEQEAVANTYATVQANLVGNLARNFGMQPSEVMKLFNPQIRIGSAEAGLQQAAFHGSPYRFDKFSLEHMGKGEGAQAYGWGLYFAGSKEVAEFYRRKLSATDQIRPDEQAIADHLKEWDAIVEQKHVVDKEIDEMVKNGVRGKRRDELLAQRNALEDKQDAVHQKMVSETEQRRGVGGQLYHVDIPEDDTMLHWDKPLSEQPEKVQKLLRDYLGEDEWGWYQNQSGEQLYRALSDELGGDESASQSLSQGGINGIKYLDQGSRSAGEGSHNYVVFDDKAINILKTYYQSAAEPVRLSYDQSGNVLDADGRHRTIAALERGDKTIAIQTTMRDGSVQTLHVDPQLVAEKMGVTPESLRASDEQQAQFFKTLYQSAEAGPEQPRGWFRVLPDGSLEIGRTKIGDLSTFVHEPAHAYLAMLSRLSAERGEQASETIKGDTSKILDFLGAESLDKLTTEQHEKFARATEQYLREGKAPSAGLRGVFQRIGVWLHSVYRKASSLGVELTPEIRDVFDRMYAAEEGVTRAHEDIAGPQLIQSAEEAGWTPEEFQKYAEAKGMEVEKAKEEIVAKLNEAAVRDSSEAWIRERQTARDALTEEINRRPEYTAMRALRKGTMEDGTPLSLNRDELVKQFGEERVKALQKQHPGLYRVEGGINPEIAAEMLGFESADHLLKTLEGTPRRSQAIEQATRDYMTAKHGDIRYDGTLQDQARLAVENDQRAANLHKELTALRQRIAEGKQAAAEQRGALRNIEVAPIAAYREASRQMVEGKTITDLQPTRYLDASRKYSREAFDALRKGDAEAAAEAKHKELMNHFLFREATKAQEFVGKVEKFADRLNTPARQQLIGKVGQDFLGQIQGLMLKYGFVDLFKNQAVGVSESLGDFLTRMRDEGQDMPIAQDVIDGQGKPYKSLSVGQLREVHSALVTLDHVARDINKITIEGRKYDEATIANGLDQALVENVKGGERVSGDRVSDDARDFQKRMKDSIGKIDIPVLRPEFLFKRLDGLKDVGPWHDAFWNKYNDAADHLTNLRESIYPKLLEIARGEWAKGLDQRIYVEGIKATVSKNDIFAMLLNSGNDSNMMKLERGGLRFKVDGNSIPLTEDVRQELFSHLNAEDIDKANQILKMISTLRPEVEKLSLKRNGIAPQWIETRPYQTKNGTLEGGYFPLVYDPRWSSAGEKQADANSVDQMFNKYATATTRQGYTKERTGFYAPLSLDWQAVVMRHLDNVMLDISHWQFVTEAQRLLKNPVVKESIISNMGEAYHKNLMDWVRFTVNQDSMGREATDSIDRFRRTIRGNVGTAVLGFRVMNAVVETAITPLLALQQAHPVSVFQGTMAFMRNPVEAMRFAENASDYMKNVNVQYDRQITEMWNDLRGDHSIMGDIKKWAILSRVGIWKLGATMAWHSGFIDAQRQGLDGTAAVRVADSLYRKIQEAGRPGDLSAVERNPYMRELTMFVGPTIIQFNNYMEAAHAIGDRGLTAQNAGKAMTVLLAGHLVNSVLFELLRAKGPKDDEKWPAWLLARMSLGLFDGVPVLNQATRYAETKITGEGGGEPRLIPVLQMSKDTVDAMQQTLEATHGESSWSKAVKQDARAAGEWTGLPMTQGIITGQYVYDRLTGQYKPAHPWSHVTDVFFSRPKH